MVRAVVRRSHFSAHLALQELRAGDQRVDADELEAMADALAHVSRALEELARAAGLSLVWDADLPSEVPALLLPDAARVVVKPRRDRWATTLAVLHEIAHWMLHGRDHLHKDVWYLTLALAMCRVHADVLARDARLDEGSIACEACVPKWAARERLHILVIRAAQDG